MPEKLTEEQEERIDLFIYRLANEGYDYALRHYSDWKDLQFDETLYRKIVEAREALESLNDYMKRYQYLSEEIDF